MNRIMDFDHKKYTAADLMTTCLLLNINNNKTLLTKKTNFVTNNQSKKKCDWLLVTKFF